MRELIDGGKCDVKVSMCYQGENRVMLLEERCVTSLLLFVHWWRAV